MVLTHAKLLELFPLKLVFPKNPDMVAVMLDVMRAAIAGPPPPPPERPDKDVSRPSNYCFFFFVLLSFFLLCIVKLYSMSYMRCVAWACNLHFSP